MCIDYFKVVHSFFLRVMPIKLELPMAVKQENKILGGKINL